LPSYAFSPSGSPPFNDRNRLGGPCDIPIILLTLCECFPERLPCLVEYLKVTQLFPRPYPRITSHVYNIYETIPPLDTTWYTIWAKVIVIVATYRRVVTCRNGLLLSTIFPEVVCHSTSCASRVISSSINNIFRDGVVSFVPVGVYYLFLIGSCLFFRPLLLLSGYLKLEHIGRPSFSRIPFGGSWIVLCRSPVFWFSTYRCPRGFALSVI